MFAALKIQSKSSALFVSALCSAITNCCSYVVHGTYQMSSISGIPCTTTAVCPNAGRRFTPLSQHAATFYVK